MDLTDTDDPSAVLVELRRLLKHVFVLHADEDRRGWRGCCSQFSTTLASFTSTRVLSHREARGATKSSPRSNRADRVIVVLSAAYLREVHGRADTLVTHWEAAHHERKLLPVLLEPDLQLPAAVPGARSLSTRARSRCGTRRSRTSARPSVSPPRTPASPHAVRTPACAHMATRTRTSSSGAGTRLATSCAACATIVSSPSSGRRVPARHHSPSPVSARVVKTGDRQPWTVSRRGGPSGDRAARALADGLAKLDRGTSEATAGRRSRLAHGRPARGGVQCRRSGTRPSSSTASTSALATDSDLYVIVTMRADFYPNAMEAPAVATDGGQPGRDRTAAGDGCVKRSAGPRSRGGSSSTRHLSNGSRRRRRASQACCRSCRRRWSRSGAGCSGGFCRCRLRGDGRRRAERIGRVAGDPTAGRRDRTGIEAESTRKRSGGALDLLPARAIRRGSGAHATAPIGCRAAHCRTRRNDVRAHLRSSGRPPVADSGQGSRRRAGRGPRTRGDHPRLAHAAPLDRRRAAPPSERDAALSNAPRSGNSASPRVIPALVCSMTSRWRRPSGRSPKRTPAGPRSTPASSDTSRPAAPEARSRGVGGERRSSPGFVALALVVAVLSIATDQGAVEPSGAPSARRCSELPCN